MGRPQDIDGLLGGNLWFGIIKPSQSMTPTGIYPLPQQGGHLCGGMLPAPEPVLASTLQGCAVLTRESRTGPVIPHVSAQSRACKAQSLS